MKIRWTQLNPIYKIVIVNIINNKFFEEKRYATLIACITLDYPLTQTEDQQVGYIYGTDPDNSILYFSRYGIKENKEIYACNFTEPSLLTKFITKVEVLKKL